MKTRITTIALFALSAALALRAQEPAARPQPFRGIAPGRGGPVPSARAAQMSPARSSLLNRGNPRMAGRAGMQTGGADGGTGGSAAAAAALLRDAAGATNTTSSLNFQEADLDIVLAAYSREVGKTILRDPKLPSNVKITLCSPAEQKLTRESYLLAIEAELQMNGVSLEPYKDEFIQALPRQDVFKKGIPLILKREGPLPEKSRVVSCWIELKHISAEEAQKALEKGFKSDTGLFQVFERANAMLVTDTQENINRIVEILTVIDVRSVAQEEVFVRQLVYAPVAEVRRALETIITESQKEQQQKAAATVKQSGSPGFSRPAPQQPRSLIGRRNGPEEVSAASNNESITAAIDDADRGMIRGKVVLHDDERSNKLIVITKKANMDFFDKVIKELDVPTEPDVKTEVVRLKFATAKDVADNINSLLNGGSSQQKTNPNSRATAGSNATLSRSRPGNTPQTYSPHPSTATSAAQNALAESTGRLTKENITVLADERINGIIVQARKQDMSTLTNIIAKMDIRLSQVLIETVFIQVALGDNLVTGVDWIHGLSNGALSGGGGMAAPGILPAAIRGKSLTPVTREVTSTDDDGNLVTKTITSYETYKSRIPDLLGSGMAAVASNAVTTLLPGSAGINYYLRSDKLNLEAIIKASKTDSHAKFLSAPVIMTVDNKEATFEATEMRYLLKGYTYSGNTYSGSAVPDYEQKDIGTTIKVTPKINPDGTVMLTVDADFKQIGNEQTIKASTGSSGAVSDISVPTFTTRKLTADITVDNRETVVFGGMVQNLKSHSETGIPLLKDIPWIGKWLFGTVTESEDRAELLVFITPYVIDNSEDARAEAVRRKGALSDERVFDTNGWSDSPLADPVSTKEQLRKRGARWAEEDEEHKTRRKLEEADRERERELRKRDAEERRKDAETLAENAKKDAEAAEKARREHEEWAKKNPEAARIEAERAKARAAGDAGGADAASRRIDDLLRRARENGNGNGNGAAR